MISRDCGKVCTEWSSAENEQIMVAEVSVVVEAALGRDYVVGEVVEVLLDAHRFLLVEEEHYRLRILQLTRIAL